MTCLCSVSLCRYTGGRTSATRLTGSEPPKTGRCLPGIRLQLLHGAVLRERAVSSHHSCIVFPCRARCCSPCLTSAPQAIRHSVRIRHLPDCRHHSGDHRHPLRSHCVSGPNISRMLPSAWPDNGPLAFPACSTRATGGNSTATSAASSSAASSGAGSTTPAPTSSAAAQTTSTSGSAVPASASPTGAAERFAVPAVAAIAGVAGLAALFL